MATCETCRFLKAHQSSYEEYGGLFCKGRTVEFTEYICRRFPRVERKNPGSWCGEHQPQEPTHEEG